MESYDDALPQALKAALAAEMTRLFSSLCSRAGEKAEIDFANGVLHLIGKHAEALEIIRGCCEVYKLPPPSADHLAGRRQ